jgi:hypothetical protein
MRRPKPQTQWSKKHYCCCFSLFPERQNTKSKSKFKAYNAPLRYAIFHLCSQHTGIAACLIKIRTRESSIVKSTGPLGMRGTVKKLLPEQSSDERKSVKGIRSTKQVYLAFFVASRIKLQ